MDTFFLKNGEEAKIEIWDYLQLKEYIEEEPPIYQKSNMDYAIEGFTLLRPFLTHRMEQERWDEVYVINDKLSEFEIQDKQLIDKLAYTRSITASVDNKLAGILICQWGKWDQDFWHYHIRFVDVHEDYKNQGVATELFRQLDKSDFLKGRILKLGMLTVDGTEFLVDVIERELKAED